MQDEIHSVTRNSIKDGHLLEKHNPDNFYDHENLETH